LRPGASRALFGVSAAELAGQHTALSDLCGAEATLLHAQLADAPDPQRQLALLCQWLTRRVADADPAPAMVLAALDELAHPTRIDALVRASRYSHRGFIAQFRQATGLGPKRYARLMRFGQLLGDLQRHPRVALAELALRNGYSDQAHMAREFRAAAGVTPTHYRALLPAQANHLMLPASR
jgi:AraC-like DNA-binding protein